MSHVTAPLTFIEIRSGFHGFSILFFEKKNVFKNIFRKKNVFEKKIRKKTFSKIFFEIEILHNNI